MKVTPPNHPASAAANSHRKTAAAESDKRFSVTADAGQAPEAPPETAKNAAAHAGKAVPPGLAKVQARLQELAASNPERSQGNALSVINRNVARYAEQQAAAAPPPATPAIPDSAAVPPPETPALPDSADAASPATPPLASPPAESASPAEASTSTAVAAAPAAPASPETITVETAAAATLTPDAANGTAA